MQYGLFIYEDERIYEDEAVYKAILARHQAFAAELREKDILRGGAELKGVATATTVRQNGKGERTVHDGPFAETREQLGGFYIVEAADLDEALALARRLPLAAEGSIEVRPFSEEC